MLVKPFVSNAQEKRSIQVFSIDTMKYSRDTARGELTDSSFDVIIEQQVKNIADLGATHIAIATPYDEEFVPFLERWVKTSRKYNLKVWFRGNFSGWEEWFDYPAISRATHIRKTETFITTHKELFEDGDIFTSCPECENGGPGEPWTDIRGYRKFLIDEYKVTKAAFKRINKDVTANYYSMNGDIAKMMMDKETTAALDGVITIDHYVASEDKLVEDIKEYAELSGGKVVLGEIGVPIPDLHGDMSEEEQAQWMANLLKKLEKMPEVIGINYWVNVGGSTALWDSETGNPKIIAKVIKNFYTNKKIHGIVKNKAGEPINKAQVVSSYGIVTTDRLGKYSVPYIYGEEKMAVSASGYESKTVRFRVTGDIDTVNIVLTSFEEKQKMSLFNIAKIVVGFFFTPLHMMK